MLDVKQRCSEFIDENLDFMVAWQFHQVPDNWVEVEHHNVRKTNVLERPLKIL